MKKHLAWATLLLLCTESFATNTHWFNLSLWPSIQVYKRTDRVVGMTLSIWGENEQTGFALGLVNGLKGDSKGFAFGVVNLTESYTGGQVAAVNWVEKNFTGGQLAAFNYVAGTAKWFQAAIVNWSTKFKGIQLGAVNYAEAVSEWGIQIGIVNILRENKHWFGQFPGNVAPFMVLTNWRF